MNNLFYELIQVSLGNLDTLSRTPLKEEWEELYRIAKKQAIVGICYAGVLKLKQMEDSSVTVNLDRRLFVRWVGMANKIQGKSAKMNEATSRALEFFRSKDFACQVLKGQGIASLYKDTRKVEACEDLTTLRQSGDVDVWVAGGRKRLYDLSLKCFGRLEGLTYHHIHFPMFKTVEVEAHSYPSFLSSPFRLKRLKEFCKLHEPKDGGSDYSSLEFNRVYILLHCYQHFVRRGVGVRQLLDYYFVLLHSGLENTDASGVMCDNYKVQSMKWIERLGMKRFAEATMWMMNEVFGLDKQYLLCEPNEEYGRFLLDEVMQTGNMGHTDERVDKKQYETAGGRYMSNLRRDARIVKICPHEALWEPIWGVYQFGWCKITKIRY